VSPIVQQLNKIELKISDYYRYILSLILGRPSNFSKIDNCLFASGIPAGRRALIWLKRAGINAVVSLTERPISGSEEFNPYYYNIPMINGEPVSPQVLELATVKIGNLIKSGQCVLVHCSAGLGRTGMVLASYFIYINHMDPDKAVEKVRAIRPGSLEDSKQVESVFKFAEWMKSKGG